MRTFIPRKHSCVHRITFYNLSSVLIGVRFIWPWVWLRNRFHFPPEGACWLRGYRWRFTCQSFWFLKAREGGILVLLDFREAVVCFCCNVFDSLMFLHSEPSQQGVEPAVHNRQISDTKQNQLVFMNGSKIWDVMFEIWKFHLIVY